MKNEPLPSVWGDRKTRMALKHRGHLGADGLRLFLGFEPPIGDVLANTILSEVLGHFLFLQLLHLDCKFKAENINSIRFLDEAGEVFDGSFERDDSGELPLEIYAGLDQYYDGEEIDKSNTSEGFYKYLQEIKEENNIDENKTRELTDMVKAIFSDGETMEFYECQYDLLASTVEEIYESNFPDDIERIKSLMFYEELTGIDVFIPLKRISVVEIPLLKIEEELNHQQEEILNDLGEV